MDEEEKLDLEHKPTFQAILETNEGRIRYQRPISEDEDWDESQENRLSLEDHAVTSYPSRYHDR